MRQALIVTMLLGAFAIAAALVVSLTPLAGYVDRVAVEQPKVDARHEAEERGKAVMSALRDFAIGAAKLRLLQPDDAGSPITVASRQDGLELVAGQFSHSVDRPAKAAPSSPGGASGFSLIGRDMMAPLPNTEPPTPVAPMPGTLVEATDAAAAYTLATQYRYGQGVARNFAIAAHYFMSAAEQGNALAQLAIGELLHEGLGVARDDVAAYVWLELAANAASAEPERLRAAEKRDEVASLLTPEELKAARAKVAAWKPKNGEAGTLAG